MVWTKGTYRVLRVVTSPCRKSTTCICKKFAQKHNVRWCKEMSNKKDHIMKSSKSQKFEECVWRRRTLLATNHFDHCMIDEIAWSNCTCNTHRRMPLQHQMKKSSWTTPTMPKSSTKKAKTLLQKATQQWKGNAYKYTKVQCLWMVNIIIRHKETKTSKKSNLLKLPRT
jgi:hypothetical protein